MSIALIVRSAEIIRALRKAGFIVIRQRGSHVHLEHSIDPTRITQVSVHSKPLPRWLLTTILRQARISMKEFVKLLRK